MRAHRRPIIRSSHMSLLDELSSKEMTPQETAEILHRIVRAVEKSERHRWMEITSAVVLSLATVASAWCAYEATRWSSVQTFRLATANTAARDAAAANFAGMQTRAFDASMLISYLEARSRGDAQLEKILHDRFRPEAKKAIEAWLKTDPFNNPAAPSNPFKMAEYVQPELEEARRQGDLSTMNNTAAQQASTTSDNYV